MMWGLEGEGGRGVWVLVAGLEMFLFVSSFLEQPGRWLVILEVVGEECVAWGMGSMFVIKH